MFLNCEDEGIYVYIYIMISVEIITNTMGDTTPLVGNLYIKHRSDERTSST